MPIKKWLVQYTVTFIILTVIFSIVQYFKGQSYDPYNQHVAQTRAMGSIGFVPTNGLSLTDTVTTASRMIHDRIKCNIEYCLRCNE